MTIISEHKLSRRKLNKIKTVEQFEEIFSFDLESVKIVLHPETFAKLYINIHNYHSAIMPKLKFIDGPGRAERNLKQLQNRTRFDVELPKNKIIFIIEEKHV